VHRKPDPFLQCNYMPGTGCGMYVRNQTYLLTTGEFHHFTVTVRVSRVSSVRIRVRFSCSDRVGIGLPDVELYVGIPKCRYSETLYDSDCCQRHYYCTGKVWLCIRKRDFRLSIGMPMHIPVTKTKPITLILT